MPGLLEASRPAYAASCRSLLESTVWNPALDADGHAVPFAGTFDCAFEHPNDVQTRGTQAVAKPPVPPEYGRDW